MKTTDSNLTIFYCKKCGSKVALIKDGSKLKKGLVLLCESCYKTLETGNIFKGMFG